MLYVDCSRDNLLYKRYFGRRHSLLRYNHAMSTRYVVLPPQSLSPVLDSSLRIKQLVENFKKLKKCTEYRRTFLRIVELYLRIRRTCFRKFALFLCL